MQQCIQLTSTNHPFDLIPLFSWLATTTGRERNQNRSKFEISFGKRVFRRLPKFDSVSTTVITVKRWWENTSHGCQGTAPLPTKQPKQHSKQPTSLLPIEVGARPTRRTSTSGGQSREEPPGPIPNPEVKLLSADGSGTIGPVRVGRRQL